MVAAESPATLQLIRVKATRALAAVIAADRERIMADADDGRVARAISDAVADLQGILDLCPPRRGGGPL